jgi:hypothetical protein
MIPHSYNRREWPLLSEEECNAWDDRVGANAIPVNRVRLNINNEAVMGWQKLIMAGCSIAHLSRETGIPYFTLYYHLSKLQKAQQNARD